MFNCTKVVDDSTSNKVISKSSEDYLTSNEVCTYLQITKSCFYEKVRNREFPVYKPSPKIILVKKEELLRWIEDARQCSSNELEAKADEISMSNHFKTAA